MAFREERWPYASAPPFETPALASGVRLALLPSLANALAQPTSGTTIVPYLNSARSWLFDAASDYVTVPSGNALIGNFGALFVAKAGGSDGATLLQILGTSGIVNSVEIYRRSASGVVRFDLYYTAGPPYAYTADSSNAIVAGEWFVAYIECKAGGATVYLNGVKGNTVSAVAAASRQSSYTIGGRTSNNFNLGGNIALHAVVDPQCFEPVSLCNNPWQVFADFGVSVAPAAAAPAGFIPAWASRASQIIGSGAR